MFEPEGIFDRFRQTFDGSAREDLARFLLSRPGIRKWKIAADFCMKEKSRPDGGRRRRPNSVYAFTLIPYDDDFERIAAEIRTALAADLKQTSHVTAAAIQFLREPRRFHIAFVLPSGDALFGYDGRANRHDVARDSLRLMLEKMIELERSPDSIQRMRKLNEEAAAKSFNINLLSRMFFLAQFLAFVSFVLARDRAVELIGWFCDRDPMTEWCDRVVYDLATENFLGISERAGLKLPDRDIFAMGVAPDTAPSAPTWFDEFVRIPDYLAGALASWDFSGDGSTGAAKHRTIVDEGLLDAFNIAIIVVRLTAEELQFSRLKVNSSE